MAKAQKAAEQAKEFQKKNDELEGKSIQLSSEKKSLEAKLKQMEESLAAKSSELETVKGEAEQAIKAEKENATMVDNEKLATMEKDLSDKDNEIKEFKNQVAQLKEENVKQGDKLAQAEQKYQNLLKSTAMQSMANLNQAPAAAGAGAAASSRPSGMMRSGGAKPHSNRNVDIQLVGMQTAGKTSLLEALIKECDPAKLDKFNEEKKNLMTHHQIAVSGKNLKLLDCSGNTRAGHLVKEWFGRSHFVVVVYDMVNKASFDQALTLAKEVNDADAKVILFGNKFNADAGQQVQIDVMRAKDTAAQYQGMAIESSKLIDAVKLVISAMEDQEQMAPSSAGGDGDGEAAGGDMMRQRSSISAAIDSVKSWFGGSDRAGGRGASAGVLRPSLKGTKAMKQSRREGDVNADLRPVQELQDSESAVTCICFGQERLHKAYVLLATASKDGTVVIYRCYRTEMEIAMLVDQEFPQDTTESPFNDPPSDHSNIAVHSRLVGHSRAITSIFFNLLEDQLVTTSIDKSVRFWGVDSGEMLKVFTDSSPVPVAAFLPFNPSVFVAANSNAVLRLVNVQNGMVLQKLKVETEVRALKFDDTGLFLLAGTKNGSIHVLEASDSSTLKFKFKVQLARGGVTCITFVPASYGQPPCLLVNTSDSSATIIDCTYGPPAGVLANLSVRHRVRVAHSLLPLKCCYSPSGNGYLISGSEDKEVYIYSLAKAANYKMQYLKHHQVPVVAVSVNLQDTLLASADSLGRIVLWRRMDFSHIPDA
jgi:WD40 repeat protein/GTPase SAR1 family protein